MPALSILLTCASLVTLALGFEAWRLTSSNTICMHTFLGTVALAYAAYGAAQPGGITVAATLTFFVAMAFGGRALGIAWRSRKEHDLMRPSHLLFTVAGTALLSAVAVMFWR